MTTQPLSVVFIFLVRARPPANGMRDIQVVVFAIGLVGCRGLFDGMNGLITLERCRRFGQRQSILGHGFIGINNTALSQIENNAKAIKVTYFIGYPLFYFVPFRQPSRSGSQDAPL